MPRRFAASEQEVLLTLFHRHLLGFDSVEQVAEAVGVSRSSAYDLLNEARKTGLIQMTLVLDVDRDDELRSRLRERYRECGVREVLLVPALARDPDNAEYQEYIRRRLGAVAAQYLATLPYRSGDHICLGGGRAMAYLAQRFTPPRSGLVLRPLVVGSRWRIQNHVDASSVVQMLHTRFSSIPDKALSVLCPDMIPGGGRVLHDRPEVRACFGQTAKRPRAVVSAIGSRRYVPSGHLTGPHPSTSSYVEAIGVEIAYRTLIRPHFPPTRDLTTKDLALFYDPLPDKIYAEAADYLSSLGIVSEVCRFGISDSGAVVRTDYDDAHVAIHPEEHLRAWRNARRDPTETILALGGRSLASAARAVLRGGYFSTMIVDTSLALALLDRKDWPEEYRNLPQLIRTRDTRKKGLGEEMPSRRSVNTRDL